MFGFSMGEMILIAAIALIAIGPKQLPEVARTIGKLMGELRRATSEFSRSFADMGEDTRKTINDARKGMNDVFTAGAASYNETVRAAPEGTVSSAAKPPPPGTPGTHPITADDPFGVGHNSGAHSDVASFELDPQGSLFVPTDLTGVANENQTSHQSSHQTTAEEEQLAFSLTSFDDDSREGKS